MLVQYLKLRLDLDFKPFKKVAQRILERLVASDPRLHRIPVMGHTQISHDKPQLVINLMKRRQLSLDLLPLRPLAQ
ncbi:hypothetical protein D3C76_1685960 [compost metagenome]